MQNQKEERKYTNMNIECSVSDKGIQLVSQRLTGQLSFYWSRQSEAKNIQKKLYVSASIFGGQSFLVQNYIRCFRLNFILPIGFLIGTLAFKKLYFSVHDQICVPITIRIFRKNYTKCNSFKHYRLKKMENPFKTI